MRLKQQPQRSACVGISGVVVRNPEKALPVEERWGCKTYRTVAELVEAEGALSVCARARVLCLPARLLACLPACLTD